VEKPSPSVSALFACGRHDGGIARLLVDDLLCNVRASVEGSVHDRNRAGIVMVETEHMPEFVHHDGSQIHGLPAAAGRIAVDVDVVAEGYAQPVFRQVADLDVHAVQDGKAAIARSQGSVQRSFASSTIGASIELLIVPFAPASLPMGSDPPAVSHSAVTPADPFTSTFDLE